MKTASASMQSHLEGEVTSLATLWQITRTDGQEFFFTDHDTPIDYDGNTYSANAGYTRTNIESKVGLAVDNLDVIGFLDSNSIAETELRAGLFDHAEVRIALINWNDTSQGIVRLRRGRLGEVSYSEVTGSFQAELRSLTQLMAQQLIEVYQPECRADLGDTRCKVAIAPSLVERDTAYTVGDAVRVATRSGASAPFITEDYENRVYRCTTAGTTATTAPTYDTAVGNTTTDGTAVFEAEEAFTRAATVTAVTDQRDFTVSVTESRAVNNWFKYGGAKFDTGENAGVLQEVKSWDQSSGQLVLFMPMPFQVQVGDKLGVYAGCDKQRDTCTSKFANILNFRGEPDVPGQDEYMRFPSA